MLTDIFSLERINMKLIGKLIYGEKKEELLEGFIKMYCNMDKILEGQLLWNSLNKTAKLLELNDLESRISIPSEKPVYVYLERKKELYECGVEETKRFFNELEPWDNVDACIFPKDYEWFVGITHDQDLLVIGL